MLKYAPIQLSFTQETPVRAGVSATHPLQFWKGFMTQEGLIEAIALKYATVSPNGDFYRVCLRGVADLGDNELHNYHAIKSALEEFATVPIDASAQPTQPR